METKVEVARKPIEAVCEAEGSQGFATVRDCQFKLLGLGKVTFGSLGQIWQCPKNHTGRTLGQTPALSLSQSKREVCFESAKYVVGEGGK